MAEKKKNAAWADCCEDWGGYMQAKKAKLEEQFQEAAQSEFASASNLFNGIAIFVNGYTDPSADELKRLMMAHGGIYHHYLRTHTTTHMIATNLPYSKIQMYRKAQKPKPLCTPEWIVDSIKAGRVLDYRDYLLYSQQTENQPGIFGHLIKKAKPPEEAQSTSTGSTTTANNTEKSPNSSKIPMPVPTLRKTPIKPPVASTSEASNSTKNPEFLSEFYNNSRLHHISTMGAMFKEYVNDLRDKSDGKFSGLEALKKKPSVNKNIDLNKSRLPMKLDDSDSDEDLFNNAPLSPPVIPKNKEVSEKNRTIMHIDMDCFFVSVGLRKHPELRGFPIGVAHAKGNKVSADGHPKEHGSMSEIASCSYEARKAGVKNGMLLGSALKLCPNLKTIPYDFEGYKEVSHILYNTVASYTLDIEAVSCDEMYADVTKILQTTGLGPLGFASVLRDEIKRKTSCPVSTGFGGNKLQARLATKKAKPDGQCYLIGDELKFFIRTLSVRDLPGVGWSTSHKLNQMDVKTCGDLESISLFNLQKEFGKKTGQQLHDMCRGIDNSKLSLEHIRKSVSAEVNYGIRFDDQNAAHEFLRKLSEEVSDRLKKINSKGKCVTLKVMFRAKDAPVDPAKFMGHGICDSYNKSKNLIAPTDDPVIIAREIINLWNQFNESPEDARGIGIQVTKLESLKSKTTGALLKFFNKEKAPDKNTSEPSCSTTVTNNIQNKANNVNVENINAENPLNITLSLQKQLVADDMEGDPLNGEKISPVTPDPKSSGSLASLENQLKSIWESKSDELHPNEDNLNHSHSQSNNKPKSSSQLKQTTQPEFFKIVKSSSSRAGKVRVPDLHELDMKVLIELPEDIRNEIFNEYRQNNASENGNEVFKKPETTVNTNHNVNKVMPNNNVNHQDKDLSFSQIDPEVLEALPDDMKDEVKNYCYARKKEKNVQQQNTNNNNNGWNMFKNEKKVPAKNNTKGKSGKLKVVKTGGKKDVKISDVVTIKSNKNIEEVRDNNDGKINEKYEEREEKEQKLSANKSFHFERIDGNEEHSEMLSDLVNCLLDLPLQKVKMQVQQWILNNTQVNDVDFLSITTFLGTLPRKKRLEDLFTLVKCCYRCIVETGSCVWHEAYRNMIKHIQKRMRLQYGYDLFAPNIKCDKCNDSIES